MSHGPRQRDFAIEALEQRRLLSGSPTITISDVTRAEGDSGQTAFVFTVGLSQKSSKAVSVKFATAGGSATVGDGDFVSTSGTLKFASGETSKAITVFVNGDAKHEPDETFFVKLSGARYAVIADAQGVATITNDDDAVPTPTPPPEPAVTLSINDVAVTEGNSGQTAAVFTVSLSRVSSKTVSVDFATASDTAVFDYQGVAGALTFAPGETTRTITVLVNGDTDVELDERYFLNLSNARGATVADDSGIGTILNDDPIPPGMYFYPGTGWLIPQQEPDYGAEF